MAHSGYIDQLDLSEKFASTGRIIARGLAGEPAPTPALPPNLKAAVDAGSILSFVSGVSAQETTDVLYSVQLAQRAADAAFDRFTQTQPWYGKYNEVLQAVGWTTEQFAFAHHDQMSGNFRMDKAALAIITAIATGNQLQAITASISALEKLADSDGAITIFDYHASADGSGNYQIGAVQKTGDVLSMAMGAFYFHAAANRGKFLFFQWGQNEVNFWTAAQKMTFNTKLYEGIRATVEKKLGAQSANYVAGLTIL